jgi:hypothetical protein
MPSKTEVKSFRKKISEQIRNYGNLLYENRIVGDKTPFESAAHECSNGQIPPIKGIKIDYAKSWGYTLSNLVLSIPKEINNKGVRPDGSYIDKLEVEALIVGNVVREDYAEDPFAHLEFNITVKGKNGTGDAMVACWHLDRHPDAQDDGSPVDIHPRYHFQHGGNRLKIKNYGDHLVLESPRVMHLPLDAVLGLDFVLANFRGKDRKSLFGNQTYQDCLAEVQKTFWRPYIHSLANRWDSYPTGRYEWNSLEICPQLV